MQNIKSHFEKVNNIASKCIIGVEYLNNNLPVRRFATLNPDIINSDNITPVNYNYKDNDGSYYNFFDVIKKVWFKYSVDQQMSYQYFGTHAAKVNDTIELYHLDDKDKINIINNEVISHITKITDIKDKLSADILQYIKKYDEQIFEIYYQLLISEIISYNQALFSITFNITLEEYNSNVINDIDQFKEIYVNIISVYYGKAVEHLKEEATKNSPDGSIDEDEKQELEMIFSMLANAVEESNDDRKDDDLTDPVDILLEYPPILFPIPDFIDDHKTGNTYITCKTKVQNYFNSINKQKELITNILN